MSVGTPGGFGPAKGEKGTLPLLQTIDLPAAFG